MKEQGPQILEQIEAEVDETVHPLLEKILNNIKPIAYTLGAIVLAVGIYSGVKYYQTQTLQKAKNELGVILVSSKNKAQDLENFLNKAPDRLKPAVYIELAKIYVAQKQEQKALNVFKKLENMDVDIYPICILTEVNLLIDKDKYKTAYQLLKSAEDKIPSDYKKEVLYKKAFLAEKTRDLKNAYAFYQELKTLSQGEDTTYLDYKLKKIEEEMQG
ncbi:ChAPs (Chs5p-Arf1p-binding protein) [Desulfonauticus submarinus]|uniref:ChAPs (Chs5p-Arf1p-binding protein) n=1 Tax=Desulfonauticus submarinus TaxID=206665 RepID=A0A1H0ACC1_9BACT|nr:hypothetical protein [Desulfonauticus submarinus]SDN31220.1 ChAPs (Chs5p-Arf1p-binding protein) [Desulfonauticus submarinus]